MSDKSSCCNADIEVAKCDEGTSFWMCSNCGNSCDRVADGSVLPWWFHHTSLVAAVREENIPALLEEHKKRIVEELEKMKHERVNWHEATTLEMIASESEKYGFNQAISAAIEAVKKV